MTESAASVPEIDWDALRAAAIEAMSNAYVPYSKFPVGVAALVDDGRVIVGLQRRERVLRPHPVRRVRARLGAAHDPAAASSSPSPASTATATSLMPCGRCRQLLFEHSAEGMLLETVSGIKTIDEVLPDAFGPRTLEAYALTES